VKVIQMYEIPFEMLPYLLDTYDSHHFEVYRSSHIGGFRGIRRIPRPPYAGWTYPNLRCPEQGDV